MTKVVIVGGGVCSGKSTIIAQLQIACKGMDIEFIEVGDAGEIAGEMARLLGADLEEKSMRMSRIVALEEQLADNVPDLYVHMHTAPSRQNQRIRARRQTGDEHWNHKRLMELDLYQRAVIPQLCLKHGTRYMPVTFDRGVSLADFLPELLNLLK
ncbi:hypothetical protein [Pseudomonas phage Nerthus]|uniref:APS kinase domain-containing protein n=1 Tax=Pseudomonas phage Nerthus TaxID=2163984 RepID=A0A2S1GMQ2_9CAUD|nr:hypothetical protein HOT09_gp22 [Pseudomonas phage Nerthus]AWD90654.1 hypothetical protein [Pseudomonas phage Nerthus]